MIETGTALGNVEEICAVPGVDGVYIGPSDLSIGIGAERPGTVDGLPFEESVARIREAAAAVGIGAGFHCGDGFSARARIAARFAIRKEKEFTLPTEKPQQLSTDSILRPEPMKKSFNPHPSNLRFLRMARN